MKGLEILFKENKLKTHSQMKMYDQKFSLLNEIENVVSDLILNTWVFFDGEKEASEDNIEKELQKIQKKLKKLKRLTNLNRTYLSNELYEILVEIELEITEQMESVQLLFFMKSSRMDRLENKFLEQIKKDRKKLKRV